MDYNNFEQEYMPMRIYYVLFPHMVIWLLYILVFFYFDKLLFLFKWIDYELLSKIIPNIFIPKLGDNGTYEKSVIIGIITLLCYMIFPVCAFVFEFKILIKYKGNIVDKKTREFFKGILGGYLDKTSHLVIWIGFGVFLCWGILLLGSITTCYMEESLIDICGVYCLAVFCSSGIGMTLARFIYRFFYNK